MTSNFGRISSPRPQRSGAAPISIALGVILGVTIVASNAFFAPVPCTPAGLAQLVGHPTCPVPPPPSPTTLVAAGTIFSVPAAQFTSFEFQPSDASMAVLNGTFTTSAGGTVLVMTPAEYTNFSRAPATFACVDSGECFTTGDTTAARVAFTLPLYQATYTAGEAAPWFLVMQNPNTASASNITWTTSLVATYADVVA